MTQASENCILIIWRNITGSRPVLAQNSRPAAKSCGVMEVMKLSMKTPSVAMIS